MNGSNRILLLMIAFIISSVEYTFAGIFFFFFFFFFTGTFSSFCESRKKTLKSQKFGGRKDLVPHGNLPTLHGTKYTLGSRRRFFFKQEKHRRRRAQSRSKILFWSISTEIRLLIMVIKRTEWSPIRSVIIRVINKIGRPRSGTPIC